MKSIKLISLFLIFHFGLSFSAEAQYVYKTPSGEKYHTSSCRTVKNASSRITFTEARKLGLDPCKVCKPAIIQGVISNKPAQGQSVTVQCKGQTKAGNRCRHKTSIGGYCYQHQPGS